MMMTQKEKFNKNKEKENLVKKIVYLLKEIKKIVCFFLKEEFCFVRSKYPRFYFDC